MNKAIDPVAVKAAVKNGQLQAYLQNDYIGNIHIMLRETTTGETVEIGKVPSGQEDADE